METFETHDLYLAAALKTHGFKLLDLRKNGARGVFQFQDRSDRTQFVKNYFSGELQGSLKAFSNAWADLKSLINEMEMNRPNEKRR
jgi:hypothetical protein